MEDRDRGSETAAREDLQAQDAELKHRTEGKVVMCVCVFKRTCRIYRGESIT